VLGRELERLRDVPRLDELDELLLGEQEVHPAVRIHELPASYRRLLTTGVEKAHEAVEVAPDLRVHLDELRARFLHVAL
jgi:hypothetical protein